MSVGSRKTLVSASYVTGKSEQNYLKGELAVQANSKYCTIMSLHDQCTGKCLVQAGQKKVIILLSWDILIWATSYIIVTAAQENLQVEAEESYYLL